MTNSVLNSILNQMNRFVPEDIDINIMLLILSSLFALMGGYLVADKAVWIAFLQCFLFDPPLVQFFFKVSNTIRIPFWDSLYDRFAFLSVNDPLLI